VAELEAHDALSSGEHETQTEALKPQIEALGKELEAHRGQNGEHERQIETLRTQLEALENALEAKNGEHDAAASALRGEVEAGSARVAGAFNPNPCALTTQRTTIVFKKQSI
jgi:predicted  nucleic acid-binding Zn-ribbon protein